MQRWHRPRNDRPLPPLFSPTCQTILHFCQTKHRKFNHTFSFVGTSASLFVFPSKRGTLSREGFVFQVHSLLFFFCPDHLSPFFHLPSRFFVSFLIKVTKHERLWGHLINFSFFFFASLSVVVVSPPRCAVVIFLSLSPHPFLYSSFLLCHSRTPHPWSLNCRERETQTEAKK